ncbi:MAG: DUF3025 domain-containing protein [Rhodocyclaceae bacterium]|nr:DUF3025 domain-containing protein [Rhodocyclaceae bacterium]
MSVLNAVLGSLPAPPRAASGVPIRFVLPDGGSAGYETRVHAQGEVETRPGNWHDFFNALAWLAYPQTKRILNGRHHAAPAGAACGRARRARRGARRRHAVR